MSAKKKKNVQNNQVKKVDTNKSTQNSNNPKSTINREKSEKITNSNKTTNKSISETTNNKSISETTLINKNGEDKVNNANKKNNVKNSTTNKSSNKKVNSNKNNDLNNKDNTISNDKEKNDNLNRKENVTKNQPTKSDNNKKMTDKNKSKEEEIVFQNSKKVNKTNKAKLQQTTKTSKTSDSSDTVEKAQLAQNKKNSKKQEEKSDNKTERKVVNNINTEEFFENKKDKKRKVLFVLIAILIVIGMVLCFSTIFAFLASFKTTIARGVSINGIDLSNLTYNEAKVKMLEAIDVELTPDIELTYKDEYGYTIKLSDIDYKYDLTQALEQACQVGKNGNIIENNFSLIKTAIFGEDIIMKSTYDAESLDAIIDIIDTNIPGRVKQYSYYIEDTNLIVNPGADGIHIKNDELRNQIITSIENRDYKLILDNYEDVKIEIPYENVKADKIDATKISEDVYTEPQNAYYVEATETTDFEIYPAKDGIALAISAEEAQNMIDSEEKAEYVIPLNITKAEIQLNDIGVEAFPYKIETFSTRYDASNYNRSKNLQIAASKINGTVLMPGEIFSFNNVVGERTVSEGYENAAIYSNGQVVNGLAGGICQISSTLYNVVLLSNLEIVERYNHSFTTSYVAAGRDATVVYGIKDFKFKNTRNYPIKIEASVSAGVATFSIYGIKEDEEYSIKIIPKTTQTMPYTTQTIVDPSLAPGVTRVTQGGASGCKVTTYKEKYLNGTLISSEVISNDVYQVMTRIVRVGPTIESTPTPETNTVVQ